jgi:hypothetical protein
MTKTARNEKRQAMQFRGSASPDAADTAATVRWLRDRELIKDLYARYAYGIDSADMDLVRSVFHPDCVVVGTLEQGSLRDYLEGIEEGVLMYDATMHFKGNQYVEINGDSGFVETWVIGYHMEAPGSPIDSLELALRYKDEVARTDDDWKIIRREATEQWHTGPFPGPFIGEPPYPRRRGDPVATSDRTPEQARPADGSQPVAPS